MSTIRSRRNRRLPAFCYLLLGMAATAHAGPFNENLRAPPAVTALDLRRMSQEFFADSPDKVEQALRLTKDQRAHAKWFDFFWQFGKAVDERRSLASFAAIGVTPGANGTYQIDATRFPQWVPLYDRISDLLQPPALEDGLEELRKRGFRDVDMEIVRQYVSSHDLPAFITAENETLARTFEARIKSKVSKTSVLYDDVEGFMYQRRRNGFDATRAWSLGLLNSLDKQRQRILASCALEREHMLAVAPDDRQANLQTHLRLFQSGEYVRSIENAKREQQR